MTGKPSALESSRSDIHELTVFEGGRGVMFNFSRQEYLYGRVFLDDTGLCYAFAFYTYNASMYLGTMRVESAVVTPKLPLSVVSAGNYEQAIAVVPFLLDGTLDFADLTSPMRADVLVASLRKMSNFIAASLARGNTAESLGIDEKIIYRVLID